MSNTQARKLILDTRLSVSSVEHSVEQIEMDVLLVKAKIADTKSTINKLYQYLYQDEQKLQKLLSDMEIDGTR